MIKPRRKKRSREKGKNKKRLNKNGDG